MDYRRLITVSGGILRRLCTAATEAGAPPQKESIYRILSALPMTGGNVSQTLNQYLMEGKAIIRAELMRSVQQLRKYRKYQHALEILEWMQMRKIKFYSFDYAVQLDLVSKTKGLVAAENFFSGLPPAEKNKYTYGALLNSYCKKLMTDKALSHFKKMDELGHVTNLAFNNVMTLYMRLGKPEKVPPLVHDLKQRKIPMESFTYHIWMTACASLNDIDEVERIYEEMKREAKYKIDWHTYCNLASIYVKAKQFEKAEMMIKTLEKKVSPRNREAYHFLLYLYAGTSNLGEVYRVWNSLKSVTPVTNNSYLTMLRVLRRLNDTEGLIKCFNEWQSSCVCYDVRLASIGISSYLSQSLYEEAALVFKEATKRSRGPFFKIRELFMTFFLKKRQLDDAVSYLEAALSEVKNDEWRPSPGVISAFLNYYEETDVDGVEELCKILRIYSFDESWLKANITPSGSSSPELHQILKEETQVTNHTLEELQDDVHSA